MIIGVGFQSSNERTGTRRTAFLNFYRLCDLGVKDLFCHGRGSSSSVEPAIQSAVGRHDDLAQGHEVFDNAYLTLAFQEGNRLSFTPQSGRGFAVGN